MSVSLFSRGLDQDWVDRANGIWSVLLLSVCSLGSFLVRYITEPIVCFAPSTFTGPQAAYAKSTCFEKEIFFIQKNNSITELDDATPETSYHLWIPLILFFQGLCFKMPNILWRLVQPSLTFNLDGTVPCIERAHCTNTETSDALLERAAKVLSSLLKRDKIRLVLFYLVVKFFYCLNLFGQFVFLTIFFRQHLAMKVGDVVGFDTHYYLKPLMLKNIICQFTANSFSKSYEFSVGCHLPISDIYEKLFVFLWYWVFFLSLVTFFNLVFWAAFLFTPFKDNRIINYLSDFPHPQKQAFLNNIGINGIFLLSMISRNSNEIIAADLTERLYMEFKKNEDKIDTKTVIKHKKEQSELSIQDMDRADDNDVPEVKIVSPEEGVAMDTLLAKDADVSPDSCEKDGTRDSV